MKKQNHPIIKINGKLNLLLIIIKFFLKHFVTEQLTFQVRVQRIAISLIFFHPLQVFINNIIRLNGFEKPFNTHLIHIYRIICRQQKEEVLDAFLRLVLHVEKSRVFV